MPAAAHDDSVQLQDRAYDSTDDLEAAHFLLPAAAPNAASHAAWSKPRPRRDWRAPAISLLAGLALGAVLTHVAASWARSTAALKGVPQLLLNPSDLALDNRTQPVRIHYRSDSTRSRRDPILPPDCPIPVVFTDDERSADVVVLKTDSYAGITPDELTAARQERPWQQFALWGAESAPNRKPLERHFNHLRDGEANETATFEMTYRLNSSVPATYSYSYFNYSTPPTPWLEKRSGRIAAAFVTNCRPKNARSLILDELIKLLPGQVDSFGSCLNNAKAALALDELGLVDEVGTKTRWNEKITLMSRYKFSVAFENSNELDYSTEKLFQAFERGTVPLVLGPPDAAKRFFPSPNAAIDVASYLPASYSAPSNSSSVPPDALDPAALVGLARLAERLAYLSSDAGRDEYEGMLAWKRDGGAWLDDPHNPLGKVVRQSHSEWDQDCRLAGVFRGEEWARNAWVPPAEEDEADEGKEDA
ncbi:hypothetical protein JCM3775_005024 [Rhodotorula graminis]